MRTAHIIVLAGAGAFALVLPWCANQTSIEAAESIRRDLDTLRPLLKRTRMQVATSTWVSGGVPVEVSTERGVGETAESWAARHAEAVAAMKQVMPPD